MRKIIVALAASVTALSATAPASASASAGPMRPSRTASNAGLSAGIQPDTVTGDSFCAWGGTGSCLQENNTTSGSSITTEPFGSGARQKFLVYEDPICDGNDIVTSNCPFTVGSGLNSLFEGGVIVAIGNPNYGNCVGLSTDDTPKTMVKDCSGQDANGTIWIQFDGFRYVNRWASDRDSLNLPQYLTSQGTDGDRAIAQYPFTTGRSSWGKGH